MTEKLVCGDSLILNAYAQEDDGSALNLTGATAIVWTLSRDYGQAPVVTKTLADGISVVNAAAGRYDVLLSPADTRDVVPGYYVYQAKVTDASGYVSTILNDKLQLTPTV